MKKIDRVADVVDNLLESDDRLVRVEVSVEFFVSVFDLATSILS